MWVKIRGRIRIVKKASWTTVVSPLLTGIKVFQNGAYNQKIQQFSDTQYVLLSVPPLTFFRIF